MNPKYNVDSVFITYFIFQCLCLKINALLRYFVCSRFRERPFEGLCLSVSPLIGCTGSSILHRESSILRCLPHIPLSVLTQHTSAASASFPVRPLGTLRRPLHAEHAHGFSIRCRDGEWTGPQPAPTKRLLSPLLVSRYRYCNEHLLCPPHVFWTGWGPWERVHGPVWGWHSSSRRRTCRMVLTVQAVMW